jgi:archaellum component FlaG (FlaF/FlaG flagellin family)
MADGGASSMVMLITALLISGGASALLIAEWSDAVRVVQVNERASDVRSGVSVALAGDPAMVAHNTSSNTITLYFLNTGSYDLDTSNYEVLIDGEVPPTSTEAVLPSGTEWNPGDLLEIVLTNSSWTYADGEDISVFFVGVSERVSGNTHSATTSAEVRLNAFS